MRAITTYTAGKDSKLIMHEEKMKLNKRHCNNIFQAGPLVRFCLFVFVLRFSLVDRMQRIFSLLRSDSIDVAVVQNRHMT